LVPFISGIYDSQEEVFRLPSFCKILECFFRFRTRVCEAKKKMLFPLGDKQLPLALFDQLQLRFPPTCGCAARTPPQKRIRVSFSSLFPPPPETLSPSASSLSDEFPRERKPFRKEGTFCAKQFFLETFLAIDDLLFSFPSLFIPRRLGWVIPLFLL